ncbi:GNAT family N-acetyltransferase, partial [Prochlorococcus sp. AH-716-O10]|nr:GNAT family N-acetyltransferase [Prochlorococcus sp. AH-716-O10]
INKSPDQSIFVSKIYLENINSNLGLYKCYKGQEIRAIVALCEDEDRKNIIKNNFVIYSGICFGPPTYNQNYSQQISERLEITNFIINQLKTHYESLEFQLPPNFNDIRSFQWHNYGQNTKYKFLINVRYTTLLDIQNFKNLDYANLEKYLKNFSSSRRQDIRWLIKNKIETKISEDINLFISFYKLTLEKSDIQISADYQKTLYNLILALIKSNKAKMYLSLSKNLEPASIAIIGFDKIRAYYLFGANNSGTLGERTGTAVLWHAINELADSGIKEIDLEGVNSPQRGWFKLSFGGILTPYFNVKYPNS